MSPRFEMQMGWAWMGVASMVATTADTDSSRPVGRGRVGFKALLVFKGVLLSGGRGQGGEGRRSALSRASILATALQGWLQMRTGLEWQERKSAQRLPIQRGWKHSC